MKENLSSLLLAELLFFFFNEKQSTLIFAIGHHLNTEKRKLNFTYGLLLVNYTSEMLEIGVHV